MKLYYSRNLNPRVAVAVAKYLKSPVEFIFDTPRDPRRENDFRAINPNTLVPVLVEDHQTLWETDAIACRLSMLASSDFWRTDDKMPEMIKWISWGTHHLTRPADFFYFERLIRPLFSEERTDESEFEEPRRNFIKFAGILDDYLKDKDWLVDNKLSYADFRVATSLPFAKPAGIPVDGFANIQKWHDRLNQIDAWHDPFKGLVS